MCNIIVFLIEILTRANATIMPVYRHSHSWNKQMVILSLHIPSLVILSTYIFSLNLATMQNILRYGHFTIYFCDEILYSASLLLFPTRVLTLLFYLNFLRQKLTIMSVSTHLESYWKHLYTKYLTLPR